MLSVETTSEALLGEYLRGAIRGRRVTPISATYQIHVNGETLEQLSWIGKGDVQGAIEEAIQAYIALGGLYQLESMSDVLAQHHQALEKGMVYP